MMSGWLFRRSVINIVDKREAPDMSPTLATISLLVALHHHTSLNVGNGNVSVLHQNEGGIVKSIPDAQQISRDPKSQGLREISRAEGKDFPIPPEIWWSTDILLIINHSFNKDILGRGYAQS